MPRSGAGAGTRATVTTLKFAGVASLGLLTGSTLTSSIALPPLLLALPQPSTASRALASVRRDLAPLQRSLQRTATAALLAAYVLSPRGHRHPYLLWTALVAGVTQWWVVRCEGPATAPPAWIAWVPAPREERRTGRVSSETAAATTTTTTTTRTTSAGSDKEWEEMRVSQVELSEEQEEQVNGEAVRSRVEMWGGSMWWTAVGSGVAFVMGVVGVWGDGS